MRRYAACSTSKSTVTITDWPTALQHFAQLAETTSAQWMLVGSAASAVHGVDLSPGDIDVLARTPKDVTTLAAVLPSRDLPVRGDLDPQTFLSTKDEPVVRFGGGWTFGRWFLDGETVEAAHIAGVHGRLTETSGREVWRHRRLIRWRGRLLPIVPLEVQLVTMVSRELDERVRAAAECLRHNGYDEHLVRRAARDRGLDPASVLSALSPNRSLAGW